MLGFEASGGGKRSEEGRGPLLCQVLSLLEKKEKWAGGGGGGGEKGGGSARGEVGGGGEEEGGGGGGGGGGGTGSTRRLAGTWGCLHLLINGEVDLKPSRKQPRCSQLCSLALS